MTKNGQICFSVPKDAECSESCENKFCNFYFLRYGPFCTKKFLENWDLEFFANQIQKRYSVIADNQLARVIHS